MNHNAENYLPDDGKNDGGQYRVFFRGRNRRIADLTPEELRCALFDAHRDLGSLSMALGDMEADARFALRNPHLRDGTSFVTSTDELHAAVERLVVTAERHQTSREEDEDLRAQETL